MIVKAENKETMETWNIQDFRKQDNSLNILPFESKKMTSILKIL